MQGLGCLGAGRHRQRQQQALDRDEAVAGLLSELLGLLEQARGLGCEVNLAGAAAFDLGQLGQRCRGRLEGTLGIAARALDQIGGQALRVVEQHLEEMLGREALMALAQGQRLRRLDEAARALGVFLEVHRQLSLSIAPCVQAAIPPPARNRHRDGSKSMW